MTLYAVPDPPDNEPEPVADPDAWRQHAACRNTDPETFFPARNISTAPARAICRACPVQTECLTYALDNTEKFGIWGGKSERERRHLRRGHIYPCGTPGAFRNGCSCEPCRQAWRALNNARGLQGRPQRRTP